MKAILSVLLIVSFVIVPRIALADEQPPPQTTSAPKSHNKALMWTGIALIGVGGYGALVGATNTVKAPGYRRTWALTGAAIAAGGAVAVIASNQRTAVALGPRQIAIIRRW